MSCFLKNRETLETPDGGIVCLDWFDNDGSVYTDPEIRPTVLILPGLTGEAYTRNIIIYQFLVLLINWTGVDIIGDSLDHLKINK